MRYFCWFFLFFALALGSCNSSEKTEKKYHPLEFQINSNLLEPKIRDVELGIEVSPPIGWKKSFLNPDNQIDINQLQALKILIGSNPQHIFQHQQTNACCIVSKFTDTFATKPLFASRLNREQCLPSSVSVTNLPSLRLSCIL